jgi:hypothetical protein
LHFKNALFVQFPEVLFEVQERLEASTANGQKGPQERRQAYSGLLIHLIRNRQLLTTDLKGTAKPGSGFYHYYTSQDNYPSLPITRKIQKYLYSYFF